MRKKDPKRFLVILPTLLGMIMIISGTTMGINGLFYAGIAVLFGGNGLLVLGTMIYVGYIISKIAKEKMAEEKQKAEEEGKPAPVGRKRGCLLSLLIVGTFIAFPVVGMIFIESGRISVGLPVFFIGPMIIVIIAIVSGVQSRRRRREYDETLYREDVKTEQQGTVDLCLKLNTPEVGNEYFVRVNCDGDKVSAYSKTALVKGEAVRLVTYANEKIEAIPLSADCRASNHSGTGAYDADTDEADFGSLSPAPPPPIPTEPPVKRSTRSKSKSKSTAMKTEAEQPEKSDEEKPEKTTATKPSTSRSKKSTVKSEVDQPEKQPAAKPETEQIVPTVEIKKQAAPIIEQPTTDDTNSRPATARPTVGYKRISKK